MENTWLPKYRVISYFNSSNILLKVDHDVEDLTVQKFKLDCYIICAWKKNNSKAQGIKTFLLLNKN